jgi:hypothetical protein
VWLVAWGLSRLLPAPTESTPSRIHLSERESAEPRVPVGR